MFVYVLAAQTFAGQAGPRLITVGHGYERIIQEILRRSGYFRKGEIRRRLLFSGNFLWGALSKRDGLRWGN